MKNTVKARKLQARKLHLNAWEGNWTKYFYFYFRHSKDTMMTGSGQHRFNTEKMIPDQPGSLLQWIRNLADEGRAVDVYLDFSKGSDTAIHNSCPHRQTDRAQTTKVDGEVDWKLPKVPSSKSCGQGHKVHLENSHKWYTPGVSNGTSTVQNFIHDLEDGTHCTLSIFADATKLERMTDALSLYTAWK